MLNSLCLGKKLAPLSVHFTLFVALAACLFPAQKAVLGQRSRPARSQSHPAAEATTVEKPGATTNVKILNFGAIKGGETSPAQEVTFTFTRNVTLGGIEVLTMGAPNRDFTNARTGTCEVNRSYSVGDSCTVGVTFSPEAAGSRRGAVVLTDESGLPIHSLLTEGSGNRAQVIFLPGSEVTLANTYNGTSAEDFGIAVDGSGNVFTTNGNSDAFLYELPVQSNGTFGAAVALYNFGATAVNFGGIAVDGSGNVYVPDAVNSGGIYKFTAPSYGESYIFASKFISPNDVTFDPSGNMFICDFGDGGIGDGTGGLYKSTGGTGNPSLVQSGECVATATDVAGNVYASFALSVEDEATTLYKWPSSLASRSTVASSYTNIQGIAVDAAGNIYIADDNEEGQGGGTAGIFVETPNSGSYTKSALSLASNLTLPEAIAIDGNGNLYAASRDTASNEEQELKLDYADPATLSFAGTEEGNKSSAQTFAIKNIGNQSLTVSVPGSGTNPSPSAGYLMDNAVSTCPVVEVSGTTGVLGSNASCVYGVDFDPTLDTGTQTGTVTITDNEDGGIEPSQAVPTTGAVSSATQFVLSGYSSTQTPGNQFTITVTAENASNGTDAGYAGTVHFTSSDGSATLPGNATLTNGVGSFNVTLNTPGSQTVTAMDAANSTLTATTVSITVEALATHFSVSAPSSATAGVPIAYTVTALTASNTTATGYTGTATFSSTDGQAVFTTGSSTLTNGVGTFNVTLKTAGSQTVSATDSANSLTGTSGSITVNPAAASRFSVTAPSTATAGISRSFSVTAQDAFNNTATSYTGTVHFTSSDPRAVLPANAILASGAGTFNVTFKTAGAQSVTATDTVTSSISGTSGVVAVSAGAPASVAVVSTIGSNVPWNTGFQITITAYDVFNNVATSDNDSFNLTSSSSRFSTPANPVSLVNGTVTASIALGIAGTQSVTAADTVTALAGTLFVNVPPGPASMFVVSAPSTAIVGSSVNFTVTAEDMFNNVVTGYNGTASFTSTDPVAVLPGPSTLAVGAGTFSVTFGTAGTQTVTATDSANSINGTSGAVSVTIPSLVVNSTADDAAPGTPGNCTPNPTTSGAGSCTLRDAVDEASALGSANISFDSTVFASTNSASANTITLGNGSINLSQHTSITGATTGSGASLANLVTVNGGGTSVPNNSTTFVSNGAANTINNLNITNGYASNGGNGGAITNFGSLAISGTTFTGNQATASGGGIFNANGTLVISNSTFLQNNATVGKGGAIDNADFSGCGMVTITNSSFNRNTAVNTGAGLGGAISNDPGCTLNITNSTISGNSDDNASASGGGIYNAGTLNLANSIVSANTNGSATEDDVFNSGTLNSQGGNVTGDTASQILLMPLGNYGGATQTMIPLPGSAAICAGSASLVPSGITTDQRGNPFDPSCASGAVDSGAAQSNYALAFTTQPPASVDFGVTIAPAPVVTITESGNLASAASGNVTMTDSSSVLSGTTSAALSSGAATFTGLMLSSAATNDVFTATLALSPSVNISAQATQAVTTAPPVAAVMLSPTPGPSTILGASNVQFQWSAGVEVTSYRLYIGSAGAGSENLYASGTTSNTSFTVKNFPANGVTVWVMLGSLINGTWQYSNYVYTESGTEVSATLKPSSGVLSASQAFTWNNGTGPAYYTLLLGTTGPNSADLYNTYETTHTSATVSLPSNGVTVYGTLRQLVNGVWQVSNYTFTEEGTPTPATLTPSSGTLSASQTFTWNNGVGPVEFVLLLGTSAPGSANLYNSQETTATSATVPIPSNGVTVFATLRQLYNGTWMATHYTFTEPGTTTPATLTPSSGTLSSSQQFSWNNGAGPADYALLLGTTGPGSADLYNSGVTTATSATVSIPSNGVTVYAALRQLINGAWQTTSYTFTEPGTAVMATLTPSSGALSSSQTFTWNNGVGPVDFVLLLGTSGPGSADLYNSEVVTATSATVSIPSEGLTVYGTLRQLFNGTWQVSRYTFTESGSPTPATLTPSSGTLSTSQTFTWNNGAGPVDYVLLVGTTAPGSSDLYNSEVTTATSATVTIPSNGKTVYATLRQFIGGTWQVTHYTFTEP